MPDFSDEQNRMEISEQIQVLVVDDESAIRRLAEKELASDVRVITAAGTAAEGLGKIQSQLFDVILLDMRLPDGDGLRLMRKFREAAPGVEIIVITGYGDIDSAVEAMKNGAYDYLTKPFNLDRMELIIDRAYQRACLERENRMLRYKEGSTPLPRLIGNSPTVARIRYLVERVAPTHVPVLITGESGTGKNVVSRNIHLKSQRAHQPLITKNCGTLQKELIRSELFGHKKGAFTGAAESRDGLMAIASKGTLFLDEIGELPLEVQASLLRVLETQTYRRVGDQTERQVDIRFIFATNRNLLKEMEAGRFSEALYHRLNVFNIRIDSLRERKEDIPLLVEYFRHKLNTSNIPCTVSEGAMQCLLAYHWPGNIRELQNVIERGIILAEGGVITERALPRELVLSAKENPQDSPIASLADMEKAHILQVLNYTEGNRARAAEILGIGRKTLYRKLKGFEGEE